MYFKIINMLKPNTLFISNTQNFAYFSRSRPRPICFLKNRPIVTFNDMPSGLCINLLNCSLFYSV